MRIVIDTWVRDDCTIGILRYGDFKCFTLELPWRNNMRSVSCVPAGAYLATKYTSPSKGNVLLLRDVPERSYIEIHAGNFTSNTRGCILVGDSIKFLNADGIPDVTGSKRTLAKLLKLASNDNVVVIERT